MARVIITGPSGVGKTTLIGDIVAALRASGEILAGFTTSEIRRGGRRTGFTIEGIGGLERSIAVLGGPGPRVGGYGVDVAAFEEVALLELSNGIELGSTLVVDEIGKMELLSDAFRELIPSIFEAPRVIATMHVHHDPLTDALRERDDIHVVEVVPGRRAEQAETLTELVLDRASAPA